MGGVSGGGSGNSSDSGSNSSDSGGGSGSDSDNDSDMETHAGDWSELRMQDVAATFTDYPDYLFHRERDAKWEPAPFSDLKWEPAPFQDKVATVDSDY